MSNKVDTSKAASVYREYKHEFILIQEKKNICLEHCADLKKKIQLAVSEFEAESLKENVFFWKAKIKKLDSQLDEIAYFITDMEKEFWILVNMEINKWVLAHNFDDSGTERDHFIRQEYLKHLRFLTLLAETIHKVIKDNDIDISDEFSEYPFTITPFDVHQNFTKINTIDDLFLSNIQNDLNINGKINQLPIGNADSEDLVKEFFDLNRDYIMNFINYFDNDLDYFILHIECLGLDYLVFEGLSYDEKIKRIKELAYK